MYAHPPGPGFPRQLPSVKISITRNKFTSILSHRLDHGAPHSPNYTRTSYEPTGAGSISNENGEIHGAGGSILHVRIAGEASVLVHSCAAHHSAWPSRCRTRLTLRQTRLNLLRESIPTRPAAPWAFTQYPNRSDYVQTFRQQVIRLSGRRFRHLSDNAYGTTTTPRP